jgi:hypothetical protein
MNWNWRCGIGLAHGLDFEEEEEEVAFFAIIERAM